MERISLKSQKHYRDDMKYEQSVQTSVKIKTCRQLKDKEHVENSLRIFIKKVSLLKVQITNTNYIRNKL